MMIPFLGVRIKCGSASFSLGDTSPSVGKKHKGSSKKKKNITKLSETQNDIWNKTWTELF